LRTVNAIEVAYDQLAGTARRANGDVEKCVHGK
jgi:hypothetical protein